MKTREVIAIDVGTASLSAALAKKESSGHIGIVSVLRYPIDFFTSRGGFDYQHRISYLMKKNIAHLLFDAHKALSSAEAIVVSVSEPFFQQYRIRKTIHRERSRDRIRREEINAFGEHLSADAIPDVAVSSQSLRVVRSSIRRAWLNGYELKDPVGYCGAELDIELELLLISSAFYDYLEEFRSRWFPRAAMRYYTNSETLGHMLFASSFSLLLPALLLDIGGEVTSITAVSDQETLVLDDPIFYGVRTLERRIAEFARCDMAHAESILRRYTSQTLDTQEVSRIESFLEHAASEWLSLVAQSFHKTQTGAVRSIFLTGQGRDIPLFRRSLEQRIANFSSAPVGLYELATPLDQLFPPKILSSGGDSVLASLLLYA